MLSWMCCREQIRQRDEDIASLQSVHAAIQGQLEGRVAELEGKLGKASLSLPSGLASSAVHSTAASASRCNEMLCCLKFFCYLVM